MDLPDRLAGAVWGHLVGDAVGVPYEFKAAAQITSVHFGVSGTHQQLPGTWSDDGALMLALLDSLLRERRADEAAFDTADQAARFLAWRNGLGYTPDNDNVFDIGGTTAAALSRIQSGVAPESAGGTADRDNGNGSLMRILPIALVERETSDAVLVDQAHRSSAITHGHPLSQAACALYVLVAQNLMSGAARAESLTSARGALRRTYQQRADRAVRIAALDELEAWTGRAGRGYVVDSFWSAWEALAGAATYREAVERAIRYGRDTDTTAAIAGGLAGIRFGRSGIPDHWLAKMRGAVLVEPLVARLVGSGSGQIRSKAAAAAAPRGSATSVSDPLRVNPVDLSGVPGLAGAPGRLGMTFLLGKHDTGSSGRHWRDLDTDVQRLRDYWKANALVLLVEDHELVETDVTAIADRLNASGVELVRYPIVNDGVPPDPASFRDLISDMIGRIRTGQHVVVACRGGLGRTGTVVACLLRDCGLSGPEAIALTRRSRHRTIETAAQEAFILAWQSAGSGPIGGERSGRSA